MQGNPNQGGVGERLEAATMTVRDRFLRGDRLVWATGLLVALLAWQLSIAPPTAGLDPSWMGGLYMAVRDGKDFGSEIVFTYGPLGFLAWPALWYSWLAVLAFLFSGAIYAAAAVTLTWSLSRSIGLLAAAAVAFVFLVTIPDAEQLPLLLAVGLSFGALRKDRAPSAVTLLAAGGGSLCAFETLIKLSVGPPIFLICLLAMVGARPSRRQWALFGGFSVGGLVALWLIAGQPLTGLWDYMVNGAQVISGYNEAMALDLAPAWEAVALVSFALGLVAASSRAHFRDSRASRCAIALTALASFVTFKYGIVRFEPSHLSLAMGALLGIWLLMPWPRQRTALFLAASIAIGAVVIHAYPTPARLDVIANLKTFGKSVELLARPGKRQQIIDQSREGLRSTYGLDTETLALLTGKRVAVDPWEIGVVWAYELDWSPLPVFQDYSAYTAALDRLNAASVEDPNGPQVILRQSLGGPTLLARDRSFESRMPAWDPPEQNLAIVCNFAAVRATDAWQVLARTRNRCGHPQPIVSRSGEPGETIAVPQAGPGELVVLRLGGAELEGLERLRSLLWRPRFHFSVLNGGEATTRIVPGTSGDGLIVSRDPTLDVDGAFAQLPEVRNLKIEGADGQLSFDFYRIRVRPPQDSDGADSSPGHRAAHGAREAGESRKHKPDAARPR